MNTAIRQAFGKRVRFLRKQQDISLRRFALMIGIDKMFLVDIEYGRKSPTLDTMTKISNGLGITLSELVRDIESISLSETGSPSGGVDVHYRGVGISGK